MSVYSDDAMVIKLHKLIDDFGLIERQHIMGDGRKETNTQHSFALALVAYEFAKQNAPELDANMVLRYALVHDLSELVTGDVSSLHLSNEEHEQKRIRDLQAAEILAKRMDYAPHIAADVKGYESTSDEESKFVYWFDKCMQIPGHFLDDGNNLHNLGMKTQSQIKQWRVRTLKKLRTNAPSPHPSVEKLFEDLFNKMHDELLQAE
jgi:5'-deoxynucleotidase YfbR-like HD superfamily hydrolase